MGGCLSRKNGSSFNSSLNIAASPVSVAAKEPIQGPEKGETEVKIKKKVLEEEKVKKEVAVVEEEGLVKKEIFVIKHRKSHDRERTLIPSQNDVSIVEEKRVSSITPASSTNTNPSACTVELGNNVSSSSSMVVRTSSCTKEEVDAILIQCGRLSRSNSSGKVASSGRKYSGSKRSYDLDQEQDMEVANATANYDYKKRGNDSYCNDDEDDEIGGAVAERRQHRQRHRHSGRPSPSSSSQGRRRTPSREREQRSGSRERGNGSSSSGRRVSRSPNRRSETNPATANSNSNGTSNGSNNSSTSNRPGKMVSVPATVSSLTMDKSNNNGIEPQTASASIKRISVKRNVGEAAVAGSRSVASPRSQSPARANGRGSNENNSNQQQQQQPSLSRSSSRKAEHSPHRRNPLSEIDTNSLVYAQATGNNKNACINNNNNNSSSRVQIRNKEIEGQVVVKESISVLNQVQKPNAETNRVVAQGTNCKVSSNFVKEPPVIGEDAKLQSSVIGADLKPQTLTRSRSARRSRDLDFNPETLLNPAAPSYTALLLEDIQNFHQKNTTTTTTIPPSFSVPACVTKACSILEAVADLNSTTSSNLSCPTTTDVGANLIGKKLAEAKDPFVESEILVSDDLTEPSFHKYVTVRRGGTSCAAEDMDGQESSGSNSFVGSGSQQHWGYSTSSWEPNSADSTDRWTSRSNTREEDDMEEARRGFSGQRSGIGRGRVGSSKNLHSTPIVAATAST